MTKQPKPGVLSSMRQLRGWLMRRSQEASKDKCTNYPAFHAESHFIAFKGWLWLTLLFPGSVFSAGFTCAQPTKPDVLPLARGQLEELDEVIVKGTKSKTRAKDLGAWLKRLEGQYTNDGYVDLCGNGNAADQRPACL
ncbi:MAG TPA: hypothetical protein VMK82_08320 [Steroidobacteraceae bacterium]|nr:hypothetical protein [Steroidobacteraceae bacterium]